MDTTQFKITIVADWGRGDIAKKTFRALKQRQTNLELLEYRMYRWDGEPFLNVATVQLPTPISLITAQLFVLKTLRSLYGGPPIVVQVEPWDGEPLPDTLGPYIWEGIFDESTL